MYVFFDTETNGLPTDWRIPPEKFNEWPRIIQLAWAVFDENEQMIDSFCELILPEGWTIPKEKFWLDKGYTQENNLELGIPISIALEKFIRIRKSYPYTIAHNISFDAMVLRADIIRNGIQAVFKAKKICTMQSSTDYCKIAFPSGKPGFKFPKLEELYKFLFNEELQGAHDALVDVKATARCFFELKKRGIITL